MNKTYHITTFGCQMNEHDSETVAGMLEELGFSAESDRRRAGVAVINTCSVRENADNRFFGTLGQLKKIKEERPEFVVCVCGCMMQQQHIIDKLKQKYSWVDIIFGTHNIHEFPKLITAVMEEREKYVASGREEQDRLMAAEARAAGKRAAQGAFTPDHIFKEQPHLVDIQQEGTEIVEGLPARRMYAYKALVNIMYGCNNFCTYCIVPYTRGRERSRAPQDVMAEVRGLVAEGVKEIMLLGQNVNSYRGACGSACSACTEPYGTWDFPDLLHGLNEIEGLERIRFMTSHPKDLSDKLIRAYTECDKLCRAIHLPVQSGSTQILQRMNRRYSREDYLLLIEKLRNAVPDMGISTDIIVGFPGETEADFEDTLTLCRQVGYDSAFTFLYSIRKGTPAENYAEQIPEEVKHQRFNRLVEVINASSAEKNRAYIGTEQLVLAESLSKTQLKKAARRQKQEGDEKPGSRRGVIAGRTNTGKLVNFEGSEALLGQLLRIRITDANTFSLTGEIL